MKPNLKKLYRAKQASDMKKAKIKSVITMKEKPMIIPNAEEPYEDISYQDIVNLNKQA